VKLKAFPTPGHWRRSNLYRTFKSINVNRKGKCRQYSYHRHFIFDWQVWRLLRSSQWLAGAWLRTHGYWSWKLPQCFTTSYAALNSRQQLIFYFSILTFYF